MGLTWALSFLTACSMGQTSRPDASPFRDVRKSPEWADGSFVNQKHTEVAGFSSMVQIAKRYMSRPKDAGKPASAIPC